MSNVFTLDSIREETEKAFAPVTIGLSDGSEVSLMSILRLKKDAREAVVKALNDADSIQGDDDEDDSATVLMVEELEKVFHKIADRPKELLAGLEHPEADVKLHLYTKLLALWMRETQLGEA